MPDANLAVRLSLGLGASWEKKLKVSYADSAVELSPGAAHLPASTVEEVPPQSSRDGGSLEAQVEVAMESGAFVCHRCGRKWLLPRC